MDKHTHEMLDELRRIYEARHGRMAAATARQFYAGALYALAAIETILGGDESSLANLRRVELDYQREAAR